MLSADVYHYACMYNWGAAHPANTAPAGFQCPICRAPVIPNANSAGPIAEDCKKKLTKCNWARQGLGLPFVSAFCGKPLVVAHRCPNSTRWRRRRSPPDPNHLPTRTKMALRASTNRTRTARAHQVSNTPSLVADSPHVQLASWKPANTTRVCCCRPTSAAARPTVTPARRSINDDRRWSGCAAGSSAPIV